MTLRRDEKPAALMLLLKRRVPQGAQALVFAATRHTVEFLRGLLTAGGMSVCAVYGQLDPTARKAALADFRAKKHSVLVVTDVAARGLDIPLLEVVINYDFPPTPKLFIHRVGRTARAGHSGVAYNFVAHDELGYMIDLQLFMGAGLHSKLLYSDEYAKDRFYGTFPITPLSDEQEYVRTLLDKHKLVHAE